MTRAKRESARALRWPSCRLDGDIGCIVNGAGLATATAASPNSCRSRKAFAGINRCDWVAKGVVDAINELEIKIPIVVRLAGTKVEEGRRIIDASGLTMISADLLAEAAQKVVAAAKNSKAAA